MNDNPLHIYESLILNKTVATARAVAAKKGFEIREAIVDGKSMVGTCNYRSDRLNVVVTNNIVTDLINWG